MGITLRWSFRNWNGDIDWIDLTKARNRWWAVVKAVMNLRIP